MTIRLTSWECSCCQTFEKTNLYFCSYNAVKLKKKKKEFPLIWSFGGSYSLIIWTKVPQKLRMKYHNVRDVLHHAEWPVEITAMCHTPARNAWNFSTRAVWVWLGFLVVAFLLPLFLLECFSRAPVFSLFKIVLYSPIQTCFCPIYTHSLWDQKTYQFKLKYFFSSLRFASLEWSGSCLTSSSAFV